MTPYEISESIKAKVGTFFDPKLIQDVMDGKKQHPRLLTLIAEARYAATEKKR